MSNGWRLDGNAVGATDFLGTTNAQPLSIRTAGTERLRIQPDGKVGIGTSNPAVKLHLTGNRVRLESAGKQLDLRADGASVDIQSDTHNLFLHSAGPAGRNNVIINPFGGEGNVGIGTGAPSDKLHVVGNVRANDVVLASDARLKTDVRPMREVRRKLEKLRGVEFAWNEAGGGSGGPALRRSAGIVAQEVESVAPELVQPEREGGHKGVNVSGLLGLLVEAFKELEAENHALTRRIEALERAAATAEA
jgi:hypothetical protein